MVRKIVLIGNGMTSYKFCEKFIAHKNKDSFELVVFGEEIIPAYDRVHLSEYFRTQSSDDLLLATSDWYEENGIILKTGELVTSIDIANKSIKTHQQSIESYDYLILATGSSAFVPPIPDIDKTGIFVYRTIEDLQAIIQYGKENKKNGRHHATVMGGGLLGLEAAKAVYDLGLKTTVLEYALHLMPRQLDPKGAEILKSKQTCLSFLQEYDREMNWQKLAL